MYACDVRKHDLGWFQQVSGVGADREICCAAGTSGPPHLGSEHRRIFGGIPDESVNDRIPDTRADGDSALGHTGSRIDDVDAEFELAESTFDAQQAVSCDRGDRTDVQRLGNGVADFLVVVTEGDSLARCSERNCRIGDITCAGRFVVVGRTATGQREYDGEWDDGNGGSRQFSGSRTAHDPAPTLGRSAGRVWQSSPMMGAIVQVYAWDSSETHQMISWS